MRVIAIVIYKTIFGCITITKNRFDYNNLINYKSLTNYTSLVI